MLSMNPMAVVWSIKKAPVGLSEPCIRPIADARELDAVYRLTHDAYDDEGYAAPRSDGRLVHYAAFDQIPETVVLGSFVEGTLVGTVSWTADGPNGLPVERDFPDECARIRAEDRTL